MLYQVKWEIDVDADSPRDAARQALRIQQDRDSIATVFDVTPVKEHRDGYTITRLKPVRVDLRDDAPVCEFCGEEQSDDESLRKHYDWHNGRNAS